MNIYYLLFSAISSIALYFLNKELNNINPFMKSLLFFFLSVVSLSQFGIYGATPTIVFIGVLIFKYLKKMNTTKPSELKEDILTFSELKELHKITINNKSANNYQFKVEFTRLLLINDFVKIRKILSQLEKVEYDNCNDQQKDVLDFIEDIDFILSKIKD